MLQPALSRALAIARIEDLHHAAAPRRLTHKTEGEGFEPSVDRKAHNGFRDRPVQPLRHPSRGLGD